MVDFGRSDDVRKQNRSRILAVLRRHGSASRKGICTRTGLSASTVSAITSELLEEGLIRRVEEEAEPKSKRGRPQVRLALDPTIGIVASLVVQVDAISVELSDYAGNRVSGCDVSFAALLASPGDFETVMRSALESALGKTPNKAGPLKRIHLGVQGVTDVAGESMLWSPITRHRKLPFKRMMEEAFGVSTSVSNDCSMIASALHWREPEHFDSNFGAVLLSHGIGMGLFLNGKLLHGIHSSGTEFGHLSHIPQGALCRCGQRGCIEAYAGDYAIYRRAMAEDAHAPTRANIKSAEMDHIFDAACAGDQDALDAYREAGRALGVGLADVFTLLDPIPIAFVGKGTKAFTFIEPEIRAVLAEMKIVVDGRHPPIRCYPDERPLIQEGCLISALLDMDERLARAELRKEETLPHAV